MQWQKQENKNNSSKQILCYRYEQNIGINNFLKQATNSATRGKIMIQIIFVKILALWRSQWSKNVIKSQGWFYKVPIQEISQGSL